MMPAEINEAVRIRGEVYSGSNQARPFSGQFSRVIPESGVKIPMLGRRQCGDSYQCNRRSGIIAADR